MTYEYENEEEDEQEQNPLENVFIADKHLPQTIPYELESFTPIHEDDDDKATTIADLKQLNNHLAIFHFGISAARTIEGAVKISQEVRKLIETRRKVKKLPYGEPLSGKGGGRVFEVIE